MLCKSFVALLTVALSVSGTAVVKRQSGDAPKITDIEILNYALTLEHLENAFYKGALEKFDNATFNAAGYQRALFEQIAQHEQAHVSFLEGALADKATKACTYNFPYTDVKSFAGLSMILEGVGVSAYLGAAASIQNPAYLTAAGSILTTEARHASYVASAAVGAEPWSGPLDVPLSFSEVYSLAAPFITGCPSTNPTLPVKAFPALTVKSSTYSAGNQINLAFNGSDTAQNAFVVFFSGLSQIPVPYSKDGVTIPASLKGAGTVYALITWANATVTDDNTVAGPAILSFPGDVVVRAPTAIKAESESQNSKASGASIGASAGVGAVLLAAIGGVFATMF